MNPFLLSPDERLADWKKFREEIRGLSEGESLRCVAHYWAQAPLSKCAYDPEDCSEWISPWEMIHAGDWCPYSVAIGMEFTLRLAGWDSNRLLLMTIRDFDISDQRMILKIDDSIVLNYSVGMVEEYPASRHDILACFRSDGKHYFPTTK